MIRLNELEPLLIRDLSAGHAILVINLTYSSLESLSRPQIELVAARVSALNQCFY